MANVLRQAAKKFWKYMTSCSNDSFFRLSNYLTFVFDESIQSPSWRRQNGV